MVKCISLRFLIAWICLHATLSSRADAPPPQIVDASVAVQSSLQIKPCQAFAMSINVKLDRAAVPAEWRRVTQLVSERVLINGREYRNRMRDSTTLNEAAKFDFVLDDENERHATDATSISADSGNVIVTMLMDTTRRGCLFDDPGLYRVDLFVGAKSLSVDIIVAPPNSAEEAIARSLNTLPVLILLADPTRAENADEGTVRRLEELARESTSYQAMLALTVGVARASIPIVLDPGDHGFEARMRQQSEDVQRWIDPYLPDQISSPLEAMAAFHFGVASEQLAKRGTDAEAIKRHRQRRDEVWRLVQDSTFAVREARRARGYLEHIKAREHGDR